VWTFTTAFLRAGLNQWSGSSTGAYTGVLHGLKVALIKAPFSATPDLVIGDVTLADYTGYAAQTVAFGPAYDDPTGQPTMAAVPALIFQPTDAMSPNTIYGHCLVNTGGTTLYGAEVFNAPFNLPDQFSQLNDTPIVQLNTGSNYGNSIVF